MQTHKLPTNNKNEGTGGDARVNRAGLSSMTYHEKIKPPQAGNLFLVDLAGCEDNRMSGNAGEFITTYLFTA